MRAYLVPAILLAACEPSSTQMLSSRVAASLNPSVPCERPASVEYLPNGTRVRIPETLLFVSARTDLTECGQYILASVTQAMLEPSIMQVVIEPATSASFLSLQRADTVKRMLSNVAFSRTQPAVLVQPAITTSQDVLGIVLAVSGGR